MTFTRPTQPIGTVASPTHSKLSTETAHTCRSEKGDWITASKAGIQAPSLAAGPLGPAFAGATIRCYGLSHFERALGYSAAGWASDQANSSAKGALAKSGDLPSA